MPLFQLVTVLISLTLVNSFNAFLSKPFIHSSSSSVSSPSLFRLKSSSSDATPMDIGEFEHVKFDKLNTLNNQISKYRITGTIKPKDSNVYLNDYKNEIKSRNVVFPGFRPGKLPPYVMADVRRYIVCFGLESLLGQLCNLNNIMVSDLSLYL